MGLINQSTKLTLGFQDVYNRILVRLLTGGFHFHHGFFILLFCSVIN